MATRKKRIPAISLTQFMAIVTATIALTLLFGFAYKMTTFAQIRQHAEKLQRELEEVRAEHARLVALKEYVQTDEYVEKIAREELNWGRYGDTAVMVRQVPGPTKVSPVQPTARAGGEEPTVPQWQAWHAIFFGDSPPMFGLSIDLLSW